MKASHVGMSIALLLLAGCATKTGTGAVVGTAGGAVAGGAIGAAAGNTAMGAILGAVVGGAAGAIIGSQMDKQAKELQQTVKGATVERVGEGIQVTFASGLLYDFGSAVVLPEARNNLRELALSLEEFPGTDVLILGHTDEVGSTAYNRDLSERRANAGATYLVAQGVKGSRLTTRGLGETEPIASNATDAGRQSNRRLEVSIYASPEARVAAETAAR